MATPAFDLFRMDRTGQPVWIGVVLGDLQLATKRLHQLARTTPGEYFVFSQTAQKIVVTQDADAPSFSAT